MARRPTLEQLLDELLTRYEGEVAVAFRAAVADLKAAADLQRLITALQQGNLEAAIQALHLDPAAYGPLQDAIQRAYGDGGQSAAAALPEITDEAGARFVIRFNARNLRAEQYLRDHSAGLVSRILDDQRLAVRNALAAGMEQGENPRTTALRIVGKLDRATGARQGGILGLTAAQERYVRNARAELTGEGAAAYFDRARRDKRFDRTIRKAIDAGEPVPAATIRKALLAYERRLLALRGEMIGRSEALRALNAGQYEALLQAVDSGAVSASAIRRTWRSAGDIRVRHTHRALNGDTVGLMDRFQSPSGALLRFPGDPEAPASETVNCRCIVSTRIDFLANIR